MKITKTTSISLDISYEEREKIVAEIIRRLESHEDIERKANDIFNEVHSRFEDLLSEAE